MALTAETERRSVLRENARPVSYGPNCAELLTSKDARSSHANPDLRLIVQNHVQQRTMDCNAAVVNR